MNPFVWLKEITSGKTIAPEFLHCRIRMTTRVTYEVPSSTATVAQGKAFSTPAQTINLVLSPLMAAKWVEDNIK
jgi:hypothetical protein